MKAGYEGKLVVAILFFSSKKELLLDTVKKNENC
jgi:hypothetical protein